MALFGTKKAAPQKKEVKEKKAATRAASSAKTLENSALENMLRAPWLSEKALMGTEKGVYVFAVPPAATAQQVARAIERVYKVVPRKVNIANLPGKSKALRSRRGYGRRPARHKAYVYLAKGDSIQF